MNHRTTILLDDASREAAAALARRLNCSTSEAIRTAIVRYREIKDGVPPAARRKRVKTLHRLFKLFEGHDAEAEVRRLKSEDSGF